MLGPWEILMLSDCTLLPVVPCLIGRIQLDYQEHSQPWGPVWSSPSAAGECSWEVGAGPEPPVPPKLPGFLGPCAAGGLYAEQSAVKLPGERDGNDVQC